MITSIAPLVASALIAVGPTTGGTFNEDWVAADAKWFVHVDVNSLLSSKLGEFALQHAEDFDIDLSDIHNIKDELGIDPLTDFTAVTVYGGNEPEDDAVIIIEMNDKIDNLVQMLVTHEESYLAIETGHYTLHSWDDGGESMFGFVEDGPGPDDRVVTLAHDMATMVRALRVMDDDAPSIADEKGSVLRTRPGKNSFFFAAALNLPHLMGHEDDPASQIIKRARRLSLDVGETDKATYATATLTARNAEEAGNIMDVINGITALGRMLADTEEVKQLPIDDLLNALKFKLDDSSVSITVKGDPAVLLKSIHQIHEQLD